MASKQTDDSKKRKNDVFEKAFAEFKEEAIDHSVAFICYGAENEQVHVWPENPQDLKQIVDKFNAQSDQQKKKNSSDLNDFPNLEGLSAEELRKHLSQIRSQLAAIRQRKMELMEKTMIKASSSSSSSDPSDNVPS